MMNNYKEINFNDDFNDIKKLITSVTIFVEYQIDGYKSSKIMQITPKQYLELRKEWNNEWER